MTEVLFYQLGDRPLEDALPELLRKTLDRGWRALVRAGSDERVAALDAHLWTYAPDAFLPHGASADGHAARQPVYLSARDENPNAAEVVFFVDGSGPADWSAPEIMAFVRVVVMFAGIDGAMLEAARGHWKRAKDAGHDTTYWRRTPEGKWEKSA